MCSLDMGVVKDPTASWEKQSSVGGAQRGGKAFLGALSGNG